MSRHLTEHDRRIWARVARTVRPAVGKAAPQVDAEAAPGGPAMSRAEVPKADARVKKAPGPLADVSNQKTVRRGKLDVEARLDLHGHTQDSALQTLSAFILTQQSLGARCVLVITGKGRLGVGVLRSRFLDWIESAELRPLIATYSRAHARHGGEGAFYLMLKVKRGEARF